MQKSRKVNFKKKPANNLNYLLNFSYDQHEDDHEFPSGKGRYKSGPKTKKVKEKAEDAFNSSHFTPYEKILAKHNFTVLDYSTELLNTMRCKKFDWDNVFRVEVTDSGEKCSICLDDLVLPKITKCGHIYCAVCLDRMLEHQEKVKMNQARVKLGNCATLPKKVWLSCPLCFSMFLVEQSKRVTFCSPSKTLREGNFISLSLFQREKEGLFIRNLALPSISGENKVSKETEESVSSLLDSEEAQLKLLLKTAEKTKDFEYHTNLRRVIERLRKEKDSVIGKISKVSPRCQKQNKTVVKGDEYFYKLPEKLTNVFLHPFNFVCLQKDGADCENTKLPPKLKKVRVLKVTSYSSITEEFLRKYSYLQHLLPGSKVNFVEVDLTSYLSESTQEHFSEEIARRKLERLKEHKLEKKRLRNLRQKTSIKDDFQQQLRAMQSSRGRLGLTTQVHSDNAMSDDLREFLSSANGENSNCSPETQVGESNGSSSIKSFANIVDRNGYFPALVSSSPQPATWSNENDRKNKDWGKLKQVDNIPKQRFSKAQGTPRSKKASRKHRVELFSTSGGRRYK